MQVFSDLYLNINSKFETKTRGQTLAQVGQDALSAVEILSPLPPLHFLRFIQNPREGRSRGVATLHPGGVRLLLDLPLSADPGRHAPPVWRKPR